MVRELEDVPHQLRSATCPEQVLLLRTSAMWIQIVLEMQFTSVVLNIILDSTSVSSQFQVGYIVVNIVKTYKISLLQKVRSHTVTCKQISVILHYVPSYDLMWKGV